ncbi:MAG: YncE family protein, partial [Thermoplasmata archaeon]|nr:YncE family protein [Thermoplasmata archaeon]
MGFRVFPSLLAVGALLVVALAPGLGLPPAGSALAPSVNRHVSLGSVGPDYPVNFTELGLPTGTNWSVTVGGTTASTSMPWITLYLPNGVYNYTIPAPSGYIGNVTGGSVTVQGGNNTVVGTIGLPGERPYGGAVYPKDGNFYLSDTASGNITVINASTQAISARLPVGTTPGLPLFDPANGLLYVTNFGSNNVTVIDPSSGSSVASISVPGNPRAAAYDPLDRSIYVTDFNGGTVSVISDLTNNVTATVGVGPGPTGIAYDPIDQQFFVADNKNDSLSMVSATNPSSIVTIPLPSGSGPLGVTFDSREGLVYVTGCITCQGTVVNGTTGTILGSFPAGGSAGYPAYDPADGLLY